MPRQSAEAIRKLRQRAAARQAWLKSPAARRARRRSRTQYRRASQAKALGITRGHFQAVIDVPVYKGLRLRTGERVARYLSDNVAIIDLPGTARRSVARSTLALRTADKVPVDLGLERNGARLEPKAPLAHVSFGDDARAGFALGDAGVTVRPDSAAGVAGSLVSDKLFFANVATDTDLVEMPVAAGVETYSVVRSSSSPQDLGFAFDLPAGAELRLVPGATGLPSGAQVVRDGKLLVDIPAAQAHDADGVNVPVSYRVSGSRLVLHVPHRAGSFRYPLLVDPTLISEPTYVQNGTQAGTGWAGWNWVRSNANYSFYIGSANYSNYGTKYGMTIQAAGAINAGNYGNWYWTSPPNTYIYRADWEYVTFQWLYQVVNEGLVTSSAAWEVGGPNAGSPYQITQDVNNHYHNFCFAPPCTQIPDGAREGQHDGNSMIYGMQDIYVNTTYPVTTATMQGADTFSNETHSPVVDTFSDGAGSGWTPGGYPSATFTAHDDGFGLWKYTIAMPGLPSKLLDGTCTGMLNSPCPLQSGTRQMTYPSQSLPEGTSTLDFYATDAVNNNSLHRYWPVKIDRSWPTLTTSGTLKGAANDYAPPNADLSVSATDAYSGVKSIEIQVDGVQKDFYSPNSSCDGCPLSRNWTWHSADYAPGDHQIKVIATDFTNPAHQATDQWTVTTDDAEPDVTVDGSLWAADQATISEPSYDLSVDAGDGSVGDPETGVKSIEILVDGQRATYDTQACPAGNCSQTKSWQFNTAQYAEGDHVIDVKVTDQAGNVDTEEVTVTVKHPQAMASQTLNAGSAAGGTMEGAQSGDHAGQAAADIGDVNADGYDDYAIGAPNATPTLPPATGLPAVARPNAGKVFIAYGKPASASPLNLGAMAATDGYTISGATALDRCGTAVTPAGDVNGDGIDDLLVGCPATDGSATAPPVQGHVYVVFGSGSRTDVDLLNLGSGGFVINGPQIPAGAFAAGARAFGAYLSGPRAGVNGAAADINGDERDDIVIGSSTDSNNTRSGSGSTYVIYGKSDSAAVNAATLGTAGFRIDGAAAGDASGFAAATVGDVNGDDLADVVVTAPNANATGRTLAGTAYAVFGKSDGANVDLANLGSAGFPVFGATGNKLGSSVATIDDLDGDGANDFAIGGHGAFVVYGHEAVTAVDFASPDLNYALQPPTGSGYDGAVVGGGGDLNGDGLPDVLVSFPAAQSGAGAVYALLSQEGKDPSTATIDLTSLPGQLGSQIVGAVSGDSAGAAVDGIDANGNDVNGDPQPAILIGAPNRASSRGAGTGGAYVVPATVLAANSSGGAAAGAPKERHCWAHKGAYPFNDPKYDFPRVCRLTQRGNTERTPRSPKHGYKGHVANSGRPLGGNVRKPFYHGKRLTHRVPIYDSNVTLLGYLEQQSRHKRFKYYDTSGTEVQTTQKGSHLHLLLETTPCVTAGHDSGNWALFSMQGGGSQLSGIRALISRSDLPANAFSPSRSNDDVIDSGWVPCHKPPHYKHLVSDSFPYSFPGFIATSDNANDDAYEGAHAAGVCDTTGKGRFDPDCGTHYWNYQYPRSSFPGYPNTVIVSASSTGIGGGGIARGVLKVGTGSIGTTRKDYIGYVDPNVPCKHRPVAHWFLLRHNGLWGWLAAREQQGMGTIRNAGHCS
jgi:hypothetical protein